METNNRKMYIDIAKVIAIFAVILVHVQINGKTLNAKDIVVGNYFIDNVWYWFRYIVTNCSNTMFMLITGATRLRKKDDNGNVDYKKHFKEILKVFLLFLAFQIPFYVYYHLKYGGEMSVLDFLRTNFTSQVQEIYWYIPWFLIPFLLILPILKKFSSVSDKKDCEYLIIIFLLVEFVLTAIKIRWKVQSNIRFDFFISIYIYPIMGDLLCNKYKDLEINIIKLPIILFLGVLFYMFHDRYAIMNVYISASVLYMLRYISIKNNDFAVIKNRTIGKMITFSASNALLFYLLHPYSLKLLFRVGDKYYNSSRGIIDIFGILLFWFLNFALCYLAIFIYNKFKKMLIRNYNV